MNIQCRARNGGIYYTKSYMVPRRDAGKQTNDGTHDGSACRIRNEKRMAPDEKQDYELMRKDAAVCE